MSQSKNLMAYKGTWLCICLLGIGCTATPKPSAPDPATSTQISMQRLLIDTDGYLQSWNNFKLSPPDAATLKRIEAAENTLQIIASEHFAEFSKEIATGSRRNRIIAIAALGFAKDNRALPILIPLLNEKDAKILGNALLSLGNLASLDTPLEAITNHLETHPEASVRIDASYCLKRLTEAGVKDPALQPILHQALKDVEPGVRVQSAAALGILGDAESASELIPLLEDQTPLIAMAAAFSLGQIKNPQAIQPLIRAMESRSPRVREAAHFALVQISGNDHGQSAWDWKKVYF